MRRILIDRARARRAAKRRGGAIRADIKIVRIPELASDERLEQPDEALLAQPREDAESARRRRSRRRESNGQGNVI